MAATGYTPISLYYSTTAATAPLAANLVNGELAINITDGKLYYKDNAGVVQIIAGKGGAGVAGGSNTQVQYNSSGSLAGSANMTFDGTYLTVNSLKDSALTSGRVTYAATSGLLTDSANMTFNGTSLTLANDASISGLTVGSGNTANPSNTAFGTNALKANTNYYNTGLGDSALTANTSGSNNTSVGSASLIANTTGSYNTAVGQRALQANTTASNNTAVGYQAGYSNSTGAGCLFVGYKAGYANTGSNNTFVGGTDNVYGASCGVGNTTGVANAAFGGAALATNTTGSYNTAIGTGALVLSTTASNNTAVGYQAGYSNTTGTAITAYGYQALYNTTGNYNAAYGYRAGYAITSGTNNALFGTGAGSGITTGTGNTIVGANSGSNNAGDAITTGSKNSILGNYSGNQGGLDIRTASNYIVLSDGDGNPRGIFDGSGNFLINRTSQTNAGKVSLAFSGATNQGLAINDSSNQNGAQFLAFYYGTNTFLGSITNVSGTAVAYNTTSDYRLKENVQPMSGALSVVEKLNPVTYNWKVNGSDGQGFIAHELQAILPDAVTGEKDAVDAEGNPIYQGIDTSFLVATLTAAIQELNTLVTTQAAEIAALKAKLGA